MMFLIGQKKYYGGAENKLNVKQKLEKLKKIITKFTKRKKLKYLKIQIIVGYKLFLKM